MKGIRIAALILAAVTLAGCAAAPMIVEKSARREISAAPEAAVKEIGPAPEVENPAPGEPEPEETGYTLMSDEELRALYSKYLRGETEADYWEVYFIQQDLKKGLAPGTTAAREKAYQAEASAKAEAAREVREAARPRLAEEEKTMTFVEIVEKYEAEDRLSELGQLALWDEAMYAKLQEARVALHMRRDERYTAAYDTYAKARSSAEWEWHKEWLTDPHIDELGLTEEQAEKYVEAWRKMVELFGERLLDGYTLIPAAVELENSPKLTLELVNEIIEAKKSCGAILAELKKYPSNCFLFGSDAARNSIGPFTYSAYQYAFEDGSILVVKGYYGDAITLLHPVKHQREVWIVETYPADLGSDYYVTFEYELLFPKP